LTTFRIPAFGRTRTSTLRQPPAGPPSAGHSYFPALDGIRALAFLTVFANHYLRLPWGWAGVDVFFVLSGFLITGILFDTREQANRVRSFYVRRILRIFPLYFGLMLALVLLYPIFRWDWSWSWLLWPAFLGNFVRGQHVFHQVLPDRVAIHHPPEARIQRHRSGLPFAIVLSNEFQPLVLS